MARLRFPGRPGHRFDRISVGFFADDVKNLHDPSLAFLPQFKRGLQTFRDLVGHSDEVNMIDNVFRFKMADIAYQLSAVCCAFIFVTTLLLLTFDNDLRHSSIISRNHQSCRHFHMFRALTVV